MGIPVVRASLMASAATVLAPVLKADPVAALLLTAACMTVANPTIGNDASFLLSFSATLGMCAFVPKVADNLSFVPKTASLRETLSATLAATVATLPVSVGVFQTVPVLSMLSNVLAIPTLAYAAVPTLAAILMEAFGLRSLSTAMGSLAYAALAWTNAVAHSVSGIPWATVSGIGKTEAAVTSAA